MMTITDTRTHVHRQLHKVKRKPTPVMPPDDKDDIVRIRSTEALKKAIKEECQRSGRSEPDETRHILEVVFGLKDPQELGVRVANRFREIVAQIDRMTKNTDPSDEPRNPKHTKAS